MNRRDYERNLSEATLLLDQPPGCNGRWQRGMQIASDLTNVSRAGGGWTVQSQSDDMCYYVTPTFCNCLDGTAPIHDGIKWCKHRIAVSLWTLANRLGARIAAAKVSEKCKNGEPWQSQHWQVLDESDGKLRDVYLKRSLITGGEVVQASCECGKLKCSQNVRTVCRHVRRCVEVQAATCDLKVSWVWDADNAVNLARMGGCLFRVVSAQSQHEVYGLAKVANTE